MLYDNYELGGCKHQAGDKRCPECWSNYPKVCECGGLIHAQFVKESVRADHTLDFGCDNCGKDFVEKRHKGGPQKKKGAGWGRRGRM